MTIQKFLITIQTDQETRFNQDPEYFRRELRAFVERLFESQTQGPIPAVIVTAWTGGYQFGHVGSIQ